MGKKVTVKWGNKGSRLQKKTFLKKSSTEALAIFSDKRKQKLNDGYRIVREDPKSGNLPNPDPQNALSDALPISGKSIGNPNGIAAVPQTAPMKSFSFSFGQKQKSQNQHQMASTNQKLAKIRQQLQELNVQDGANPHKQPHHASQNMTTDEEDSSTTGPKRNGNKV